MSHSEIPHLLLDRYARLVQRLHSTTNELADNLTIDINGRIEIMDRINNLYTRLSANLRFQDEIVTISRFVGDDYDTESVNSDYDVDNVPNEDLSLSLKKKPKLSSKRFSKKDALENVEECPLCYDSFDVHNVVTIGCSHKYCVGCMIGHLNASCTNQPYAKCYSCPICRSDIKSVQLNYTCRQGTKNEVMSGINAQELKKFCC